MIKQLQIPNIFVVLLILLCGCANGTNFPEKIMKDNKLTVIINKPIHEVFEFTTDPHKTPEWITSVEEEQTNEWPPKLGTIYKNRGQSGPWSVYKVSKYEDCKEFELVKQDESTYHVNYSYSSLPSGATQLIYHEWVTTGELEDPFPQVTLDKLKKIVEEKRSLTLHH
jgi:hypothetical protein